MSGEAHIEWTNGLDGVVITSVEATIVLLKTALEETVPRLHVPQRDPASSQQLPIRPATGLQVALGQDLGEGRLIIGRSDQLEVYKGINFSSRRHGGDVKVGPAFHCSGSTGDTHYVHPDFFTRSNASALMSWYTS
ncbi:hypothetical protein PILCRDRAFT_6646 [Piloderma croceum F 1598]|uniref:Uncharacterized protein n=1 Tax=Piloderma croceum (strain F 1598) TaxID=765440 RepID=A0A0C3C459_PILCF|nr:hypothetical protein PILCRDRAFT_6646 [Piloderma croceum F 1598]